MRDRPFGIAGDWHTVPRFRPPARFLLTIVDHDTTSVLARRPPSSQLQPLTGGGVWLWLGIAALILDPGVHPDGGKSASGDHVLTRRLSIVSETGHRCLVHLHAGIHRSLFQLGKTLPP